MWLRSIELALAWSKLYKKTSDAMRWPRILGILITLTIPTLYVISTYAFGLNQEIVKVGEILGV